MYLEKPECISSSVPNGMIMYVKKSNLRILYECKQYTRHQVLHHKALISVCLRCEKFVSRQHCCASKTYDVDTVINLQVEKSSFSL